jgi:hypothetical protein
MTQRSLFNPKNLLAAVVVYSAFGWFVHWLSQLPISISLAVAAVALMLNGLMAEIEQRLSDGHPDARKHKSR